MLLPYRLKEVPVPPGLSGIMLHVVSTPPSLRVGRDEACRVPEQLGVGRNGTTCV